jgi:hypothetical protein
MILDFQQGIITYPTTSGLQSFLVYAGGYVNLQTVNGRVDITFAHGQENYLLSESSDVPTAWGPLVSGVDYWLYWDIDLRTGVRTFGTTQLAPAYGPSFVGTPALDQHWFDTSARKMYVFGVGGFHNVARVFAAKINTTTLTPLGSGNPSLPYSGTQAGLNIAGSKAGRIIVDDTGNPIRRVDGRFFTSESEFFVNGSPVNVIRLEANIVTGTATEPIAKFQIVKFTDFGKISPATYDDIGSTAIAVLMEDLSTNATGTVCVQGHVTNPAWNWTTIGAFLWIDNTSSLTIIDPHVADSFSYPTGRVPVGRVLSKTSVIFDQGLGSKGDKGDPGLSGVTLATVAVAGVAKLSVPAANAGDPIVVGHNDVRLTNKVLKAGDTMTGPLVLNADPLVPLGAATKQYVDAATGDPGGANTHIQYNNAGTFGGSASFTYNGTNLVSLIGDINVHGGLQLGNLAQNAIYKGGTDFFIARNYTREYTIWQVWAPPSSNVVTDERESTLALVREDTSGNAEFIDVYNNGYLSEKQHGIRIQKRGTGSYRDFVIDYYDGTNPKIETFRVTPTYTAFRTSVSGITTERLRLLGNGAWSVGSTGTDTGTPGQVLTSTGPTTSPTWQQVPDSSGADLYLSQNFF